jgi:hypothetical protein
VVFHWALCFSFRNPADKDLILQMPRLSAAVCGDPVQGCAKGGVACRALALHRFDHVGFNRKIWPNFFKDVTFKFDFRKRRLGIDSVVLKYVRPSSNSCR